MKLTGNAIYFQFRSLKLLTKILCQVFHLKCKVLIGQTFKSKMEVRSSLDDKILSWILDMYFCCKIIQQLKVISVSSSKDWKIIQELTVLSVSSGSIWISIDSWNQCQPTILIWWNEFVCLTSFLYKLLKQPHKNAKYAFFIRIQSSKH